MRITTLVVLFAAIFASSLNAQKINYTAVTIADSIKNNANAVIRLNQLDISIASQRSMNIKTKRVVTVLNELGLKAEFYFEVIVAFFSISIIWFAAKLCKPKPAKRNSLKPKCYSFLL